MPKTFLLVGLISLNYKAAPIEIRERFHFEDSEKLVFNNLLKKNVGVEGLMIISTCNRTEIYFEFENQIARTNPIKTANMGNKKLSIFFKN